MKTVVKKNDVVVGKIVDITNEGFGVAKVEEFAIFVPFVCIGEVVEIKVLKVLPKYGFGKVMSIIEPSAQRIDPDCKVYDRCGGCSLRHMSYEEECRIKENYVYDTLSRVGNLDLSDVEKRSIVPSAADYGYRNKAQYPIRKDENGKILIGFYAKRSHDVVDSSECRLQPAFFSDIVSITRSFLEEFDISIYNEETHKGLVRHLYVRHGEKTDQTMVCLVINGKMLPEAEDYANRLQAGVPSLASVVLNINKEKTNVILGNKCITICGSDTIEDELCELRFQLSPLSFYQVNRAGAERLYGIAKEFAQLKKDDVLLDLYCGAGTIGLSMANDVKELIGVEIIEDAVNNATENAKRNHIVNAQFICADASGAAQRFVQDGVHPNVIVLDPPRKGLTEEVIQCVHDMNPERVVIVSCNVVTLARDLKLFETLGYLVQKVQPMDMFPRTNHVETVVLMSRVDK